MLTLLLGPLLNLLLSTLNEFGVNVPSSISSLVTQLFPVVQNLVADIQAGGSPSAETITILQTLLPAIQAIKADTMLDPKYIQWATLLDDVLAKVLTADQDAQTAVDPSKLLPEV
jgi:hypothetical protein